MIKLKIAVAVAFLGFTVNAIAAAPICPHYEQSELTSMTDDQLQNLLARYTVVEQDGYGNRTDDDIACGIEYDRIKSIIDARVKDEIHQIFGSKRAIESKARGQLFAKTPEGKIYVEMQKMCGVFSDEAEPFEGYFDKDKSDKYISLLGDAVVCDISMSYSVAHDENCGTLEDPDPNDPDKNDPKVMACLESYKPKVQELIKNLRACGVNEACINSYGDSHHL